MTGTFCGRTPVATGLHFALPSSSGEAVAAELLSSLQTSLQPDDAVELSVLAPRGFSVKGCSAEASRPSVLLARREFKLGFPFAHKSSYLWHSYSDQGALARVLAYAWNAYVVVLNALRPGPPACEALVAAERRQTAERKIGPFTDRQGLIEEVVTRAAEELGVVFYRRLLDEENLWCAADARADERMVDSPRESQGRPT